MERYHKVLGHMADRGMLVKPLFFLLFLIIPFAYSAEFDTKYVKFNVPEVATHYWEPIGLDTYEVIVNMTVNKQTYFIKATWKDTRYPDEVMQLHYMFNDGILTSSDIKPYSLVDYDKECMDSLSGDAVSLVSTTQCKELTSKSALKFYNIKYEIGTLTGYTNESFLECADCNETYISEPKFVWKPFEELDTKITKNFYAVDDTAVTACGALGSSNIRYYLTKNISSTTSTNGAYCIRLSGNNVELDCQGYNITYVGTSNTEGSYGILLYTTRYNFTVKNCNIYRFYAGIRGGTSYNITVLDSNFYSQRYVGIWLQPSYWDTFDNLGFYDQKSYGMILATTTNDTISDLYFQNITSASIYGTLRHNDSSYSNIIINNTDALGTANNGIYFNTAYRNFISGVTMSYADIALYLVNSDDNAFEWITAINNTYYAGSFLGSSRNNVSKSVIDNSSYGFYFTSQSDNNTLYQVSINNTSNDDIRITTQIGGDCSGDDYDTCEEITAEEPCGAQGCGYYVCDGWIDCTIFNGDESGCLDIPFCSGGWQACTDQFSEFDCNNGPPGYCEWTGSECIGTGWCWGDGNCIEYFFTSEECLQHEPVGCYENFYCEGGAIPFEITCPEWTNSVACIGDGCDWETLYYPEIYNKGIHTNLTRVYVDTYSRYITDFASYSHIKHMNLLGKISRADASMFYQP